jgi:hypothetical protein
MLKLAPFGSVPNFFSNGKAPTIGWCGETRTPSKTLTSIKTLPPSSAMKFDMEGVEMYHFNKLSSMSQLRTYSISTIGYASKK